MKLSKIFSTILFSIVFLFACANDCQLNKITPDTLPNAKLGLDYSAKIEQSSSCSFNTKKVEVISGQLPPGILMEGNGVISGKATNIGSYTFEVKFEVCFGTSAYGATDCKDLKKSYTITVE